MYRLSGAIALMSLLVTLNPFLNRETGSLSVAERLSLLAYIQLAILMPTLFVVESHVDALGASSVSRVVGAFFGD